MDCRTGFREMLGIEGPLTRETLERALYDYLIRGAINPRPRRIAADEVKDARADTPPPARPADPAGS